MGSTTPPTFTSASPLPPKPWIQTPLIRSSTLSREAGCNIYLKLETLQPSGSFKSRGIGNLLLSSLTSHGTAKPIHFYCSSGGNAGLACATAAKSLGRPATIVVPFATPEFMVGKLRKLGAHVVQKGNHWQEADTYLRNYLLANDVNGVYVPPFDHPDIWDGNSTLIDELETQFAPLNSDYDAVVCSVGGGGLFAGIMQGLARHSRIPGFKVLAVETEGAHSLAHSLRNNALSRLPAITSIATSLGATQVAAKAFEWAQRPEVHSRVVSDAQAAMACVEFADDERIIVESACGASIAAVYNNTLRSLYPSLSDAEFSTLNIVVVVCGGSNISLAKLQEYRETYGRDESVVNTFHQRKKSQTLLSKTKEPVPFVLHSEPQHEKLLVCDDKHEPPRPATAVMEKVEQDNQVGHFGKVIEV